MGFATTTNLADVTATETAGTSPTVPHGDHGHALPALGAWTTYTPTFTNITSGAGTFAYAQFGKTVHLRGNFSAGTATAAASIQVSLPSGMTATAATVVAAQNNNTDIGSNITTTVRIFADTAAANWGVGASIASVHFNVTFEIT